MSIPLQTSMDSAMMTTTIHTAGKELTKTSLNQLDARVTPTNNIPPMATMPPKNFAYDYLVFIISQRGKEKYRRKIHMLHEGCTGNNCSAMNRTWSRANPIRTRSTMHSRNYAAHSMCLATAVFLECRNGGPSPESNLSFMYRRPFHRTLQEQETLPLWQALHVRTARSNGGVRCNANSERCLYSVVPKYSPACQT